MVGSGQPEGQEVLAGAVDRWKVAEAHPDKWRQWAVLAWKKAMKVGAVLEGGGGCGREGADHGSVNETAEQQKPS